MKKLLSLAILAAVAAAAADVSGTWKGTAEGPNGAIERTFVFKQDGSKLTGETSSEFLGKSEIQEGKVEGDDISFSITANFNGNQMKLVYKGKINGDEIKLTSTFGDQSINWTLKKAS